MVASVSLSRYANTEDVDTIRGLLEQEYDDVRVQLHHGSITVWRHGKDAEFTMEELKELVKACDDCDTVDPEDTKNYCDGHKKALKKIKDSIQKTESEGENQ